MSTLYPPFKPVSRLGHFKLRFRPSSFPLSFLSTLMIVSSPHWKEPFPFHFSSSSFSSSFFYSTSVSYPCSLKLPSSSFSPSCSLPLPVHYLGTPHQRTSLSTSSSPNSSDFPTSSSSSSSSSSSNSNSPPSFTSFDPSSSSSLPLFNELNKDTSSQNLYEKFLNYVHNNPLEESTPTDSTSITASTSTSTSTSTSKTPNEGVHLFNTYVLFSEDHYSIPFLPLSMYDYLLTQFQDNHFRLCVDVYTHVLQRLHSYSSLFPSPHSSVQLYLEAITRRFISCLSHFTQHVILLRAVSTILNHCLLPFHSDDSTLSPTNTTTSSSTSARNKDQKKRHRLLWESLINTVLSRFTNDIDFQRLEVTGQLTLKLLKAYTYQFPEYLNSEQLFFWQVRSASYLQEKEQLDQLYQLYLQKTASSSSSSSFSSSYSSLRSRNKDSSSSSKSHRRMSYFAYNEFIQAFARIGNDTLAESLMLEAIHPPSPSSSSSSSSSVPLVTIDSANSLMQHCVRTKDIHKCKAYLTQFTSLFDVHHYSKNAKDYPLYATFIECCRVSLVHDRFERTTLYSHHELVHRWNVATEFSEVLNKMNELGLKKDQQCYESILTCLVYANYDDYLKFSISKAIQVLNEMTEADIPLTPYAFQTIMRGLANTWEPIESLKRPKLVEQYMTIMQSAGFHLDARTYSIYFLSYLPLIQDTPTTWHSDYLTQLDTKVKEMVNQSIAHTHESIHALMRVYGAFHLFDQVLQTFATMPLLQLPRTAETYFTVFHAASLSEPTSVLALQVLLPLLTNDNVAMTDTLMHTLFSCCVACNNVSLAWTFYHELERHQLPLTHTILNYLLKLSIYNSNLEDAQFILDEFHRRQWFFSATTYYHLMNFYTHKVRDHAQMKLLFRRVNDQLNLVQEFSKQLTERQNSNPTIQHDPSSPMYSSSSSSSSSSSFVPFQPKPTFFPSDASLKTLTLPPLPPLPPLDSPLNQHPIPILSDSRLCLKALQMFIEDHDLPSAVKAFSNLLTDFHLCLFHRYAIAQEYLSEAQVKSEAFTPGRFILSYPPRIFEYHPMSTQTGSLYLPQDVAKGTWLLCTAILNSSFETLPNNMPPLAYAYAKTGFQPSSLSSTRLLYQEFFDHFRCSYIPISQKPPLYAARLVFLSSLRVLLSYQDFQFVVQYFSWVRDLMQRLGYSVELSLQHGKWVAEEEKLLQPSQVRNLLTSIWDTPNLFHSDSTVWKSVIETERNEFQSVQVASLSKTAKLLGISPFSSPTTSSSTSSSPSDSSPPSNVTFKVESLPSLYPFMKKATQQIKADPRQLEYMQLVGSPEKEVVYAPKLNDRLVGPKEKSNT